MNLKLLIVLLALCLSACGKQQVKDDAPANDLDVLVQNVRKDGKPVVLPNGKWYCFELATTEDMQDDCTGDLEDALFNSNKRGLRQVETVEQFVAREKLRRNPCGFWERFMRADRCSKIPPHPADKNSATAQKSHYRGSTQKSHYRGFAG